MAALDQHTAWLEHVPPYEYMDLYLDLCEHSCQDLLYLDIPFEEIVARRDLEAIDEAHFFSGQQQQQNVPSVTFCPTPFDGFASGEFVPESQVTTLHPNENPSLSCPVQHERSVINEANEIILIEEDLTTTSTNDPMDDTNDDRPISDDGSSFESLDRFTWEDHRRSIDFDRSLPVMCLEINSDSWTSDATDSRVSDDLSTPDSLLPSDVSSTTSSFERVYCVAFA